MSKEQIRRLLIETAGRLFAEAAEPEVQEAVENGRFPDDLWASLEENGLVDALLPESVGGSGFDFCDALSPLRVAGAFALPVPLLETMVGRRLLADVGLSIPEGPLGLVFCDTRRRLKTELDAGVLSLTGSVTIPWPNEINSFVVVDLRAEDALVGRMPVRRDNDGGRNMCGEPVRRLELDDSTLEVRSSNMWPGDRALWVAAAGRTQMIAGAMDRVLDLSIEHAQGREQFGRPIAKFQAVQHLVAQMAAEVAAVGVAADSAAEALEKPEPGLEVGAAKARASESAEKVAKIAHQIHAALGYTREHTLHRFTRRLWHWRDLDGDELFWQERVGRRLVAEGGDQLWPLLSQ